MELNGGDIYTTSGPFAMINLLLYIRNDYHCKSVSSCSAYTILFCQPSLFNKYS